VTDSTKGRLSISLFWQWLKRVFKSGSSLRTWCSSDCSELWTYIVCDNISDMIWTEELRFHQETEPIQTPYQLIRDEWYVKTYMSFEWSDTWRRIWIAKYIRFWIFQIRWLKPLPHANMIVTRRPWVHDLKSVN
jgi:hypothetical protein